MRPIHRAAPMLALAWVLLPAPAAHGQDVAPVVDRIAAAWSRGNASGVASFAARGGMAIEVDGERHGPLNARQATAVLRGLFENRETVSARTGMAKVLSGSPQRAFGELTWTLRVRGTTVPQRTTVFIGLALEDEAWRITEIRVMQ
jgi:hypothetical protein